jgi:hypothetical protein
MKFDCFAFVDAQNKTLLTRAATTSLERVWQELAALRAKEGLGPVFALRSYTNNNGDEVATEMYTDAALRALAQDPATPLSKVEVLHGIKRAYDVVPELDGEYTPDGHVAQAVLLVPTAGAMQHAYHATQSAGHAWNPVHPSRSTVGGDIFILDGQPHLIGQFQIVPIRLVKGGKEVRDDV